MEGRSNDTKEKIWHRLWPWENRKDLTHQRRFCAISWVDRGVMHRSLMHFSGTEHHQTTQITQRSQKNRVAWGVGGRWRGGRESVRSPEFPVQSAGDSKQMVFLKIFEVGHLVSETAIIKILEPNSKKGIDYYDTIHDTRSETY